MTEDEMVGWHHQFNGYEFDQALGNSEGQGSLACCSPWDHKESDTIELMNNNNVVVIIGLPEIEEFHWVQIEKKGGVFARPFVHLQKGRVACRGLDVTFC